MQTLHFSLICLQKDDDLKQAAKKIKSLEEVEANLTSHIQQRTNEGEQLQQELIKVGILHIHSEQSESF